MTDIRTRFDPITATFDWALGANARLEEDAGLETAVILSLFTDRRAAATDELPDGTQDRRGWPGDSYAEDEGDQIGSRLWLLTREKQTDDTLRRAREYALEALAWLTEDGVARAVDVEAEWSRMGALGLGIRVQRPDGRSLDLRFEKAWEAQANAV